MKKSFVECDLKLIKLFYSSCAIFFLTFIFPSVCWAATYYVSPTGNASASTCTTSTSSPCSLNTGLTNLRAGDTLILANGEYRPTSKINIDQDGVTIKAANRGQAHINGVNIPSAGTGDDIYDNWIMRITGDNNKIEGIEVSTCKYYGVWVFGSHNTLSFLNAHDCQGNGILINDGDDNDGVACTFTDPTSNVINNIHDNIVEDSKIWHNVLVNQDENLDTWPTGMSAARCPYNTIFRRNEVYNNYGEGLSSFDAYNTVFEDNVVHDNWAVNLYLDGAPGSIVRRNLIYTSPGGNLFTIRDKAPGIGFTDERDTPLSRDVTIVNNMVMGGNGCFNFGTDAAGAGLKNFFIANNTFVNADYNATIKINSGSHSGSRFMNNIILEEDGSMPITAINSSSGITFSTNLWSRTPQSSAQGTGLNSGYFVGDPLLVGTGAVGSSWFKISSSNSPAINRGVVLTDTEIRSFCGSRTDVNCYTPIKESLSTDFFGASRSNPSDLGAYEYISSGGATSTPTPTPTPSVVCLGADTTINGDDLTAWAKSYSIINNVLKFAELITHWGEACR